MKPLRATLPIIGLALAMPAPLLAQDFEGTIKSRTVTVGEDALYERLGDDVYGDEPEAVAEKLFAIPVEQLVNAEGSEVDEQTVYLKRGKLRVETVSPDGQEMYVIIDYAQGTTLMVFPAARSYMKMTRQDMEEAQERANAMMGQLGIEPGEVDEWDEEDVSKPVVRALGTKAVINGMEAMAYQITGEYEVVRGWVAADRMGLLKTMKEITAQLAMMEDDEEYDSALDPDELLSEYGIPIRIQTFAMDELRYGVEDVLEIKQQSVSEDLFQVPAGYTEQRFPFGGQF